MANVRITSSFTGAVWEGEVRLLPGDDANQLEQIFRIFNRVDRADVERLAEWGYTLPSLSAGDRVELRGKAYEVRPVGFEPDEREELQPWPLGERNRA